MDKWPPPSSGPYPRNVQVRRAWGAEGAPGPSTTCSQVHSDQTPQVLPPPHSPLDSVSWTPRSSLARSWAWAPSAPESARSPEALLRPARPVGCIPEGWGVSGMGGAWCERCWVWSWCWGGEERAESKGCARTAAGQVKGKRQPWVSQQWGLGVEGQGRHPGCPQYCSEGHRVPPTNSSHPGLDGRPAAVSRQ